MLSLLPVPSKDPISDPGVETTAGTSGVNSPQPEWERRAARRGEEDSLKTKFLPERGGCGSGSGRGLNSSDPTREEGTSSRGATSASRLPAVSPGAPTARHGFPRAASSLGRGHFRTPGQPWARRTRVGGEGSGGQARGSPALPGPPASSGFPSD